MKYVLLGYVRDDGVFSKNPQWRRPGDVWTPVYTQVGGETTP